MKVVKFLAVVDEAKCDGCKLCELICPTGAIKVVDRMARVADDRACVACLRCSDRCSKQDAISMLRRPEPVVFGTSTADVDQAELRALCLKAHREPHEQVCVCTGTSAGEIAAAIMKGARSVPEVIKATGSSSGCQEFCVPVTQRLLKACGVDITRAGGPVPYDQTIAFWELPGEIAEKYPHYCFKEDEELARKLGRG